MKCNIYLMLLGFLFPLQAAAIILTGSTTISGIGTSIAVEVNTETALVTFTLTGPDDRWFAFGFGATEMEDTYATVIQASGPEERQLGHHSAGVALTSSLTVVSDVSDSGSRTVVFTRPIIGATANHYTFPTTAQNISIIYARGQFFSFDFHGAGNNGSTSLSLAEVSLPVQLSSFEGLEKEDQIQLRWITESEVDNIGFEVFRSLDAIEWEQIGFVHSSGISTSTKHYTFVDEDPRPGINYYRLKQFDADGQFEYLPIIGVELVGLEENNTIQLFPTITDSYFKLLRSKEIDELIRIQILDSNFQLLLDLLWHQNEVDKELDISYLPPAMYFVILKHEQWTSTHRVIKK